MKTTRFVEMFLETLPPEERDRTRDWAGTPSGRTTSGRLCAVRVRSSCPRRGNTRKGESDGGQEELLHVAKVHASRVLMVANRLRLAPNAERCGADTLPRLWPPHLYAHGTEGGGEK